MFSTEKEEIVYNVLNIFATKKATREPLLSRWLFSFCCSGLGGDRLFLECLPLHSTATNFPYWLLLPSPIFSISVEALAGLTFDFSMQYRVIAYILYKLTALRRNPQRAVNLKKKKKKV